MSLLEVSGLKKIYTTRLGGNQVEALRNVNFTVEEGEYIAIMGESGSGKTTLLNILAALDTPTAGSVRLNGQDLSGIREADRSAFRRDHLGFVFQEFNLLDTFTVEDNIYLPLVLAGVRYEEMKKRLTPIAERLGIVALLKKVPLRDLRRSEAACRRGKSADHQPSAHPCGRADRRPRLPCDRRPAPPVCGDQPHGSDRPHGHPLGRCGKPRRQSAFH